MLLLILGCLLSTNLIACGGSGAGSDNGPTTISFWVRNSDADLVAPVVKAYNKSHKNQIKLTLIPAAQFVTKFGTAIAAGTAPDVVAIDLIYMPAFDAASQMTDITDFAHKLPYFDKLSPSHIRLATYQNKVYGVPFSAEGSVLLYNKDLFKKAGLDPAKPPTTWAEIEADSKKITALGNGVKGYYFAGSCAGCNAFTFLPYIWASGGDVVSADGTKATMDSPVVKDAMSFYRRLWTENQVPAGGKVDDGTNSLNVFTTGKIGMVGSGAFSISILKNQHPDIDFGVTYLPGQNGGHSSFAGGDTIGIPNGSKHVSQAQDFISWLLSDDTQLNVFAKNNSLPVRTDLTDNKYFQQDPRYQIVANAMAQGRTPYSIKYNQLFNDQNGPWIGAFQKCIFDGQIDQGLNTAQQQFTQILNSQS
ncbi:ABC transporter substrate-binding protein [Dictyobacter aurantiacus]|uniref:ABC transporter substrate-binding protein n=2 Tax=Dictyobacter aurantiacus TaxID=1936993 RepID=A0A401ZLW3_9CHLR|nr:ABC transporter substrate-binding protein [Dictyobacter aurantiacus]